MAYLKSATGTIFKTIKTDKVKLTPTTTANAPTGTEGNLYYDSDDDELKQFGTSWQNVDGT